MIHDTQPDIFGAVFCDLNILAKMNEAFVRRGIKYRLFLPIAINIPVNEKYDETLNYIKEFTNPIAGFLLNLKIPFVDIYEKIEKASGFKKVETDFNWKQDTAHELTGLNFTPLFVEQKYFDHCENDLERSNYKKLVKLESSFKEDIQTQFDKISKDVDEETKK